jgi:hypothetical protein
MVDAYAGFIIKLPKQIQPIKVQAEVYVLCAIVIVDLLIIMGAKRLARRTKPCAIQAVA